MKDSRPVRTACRMTLAGSAAFLSALSAVAAGCAFDARISVQASGHSPVVVAQSAKPEQSNDHVRGTTTREGQVVAIDCTTTIVYDIVEAGGAVVLPQRYVAHLHTGPLARGTSYAIDCTGPLVVELPAAASHLQATATRARRQTRALPIQAHVRSLQLAFRKRLRAEAGTQLAVIRWPRTRLSGDYKVALRFELPDTDPFRERVLRTASIACGGSRYLQPILPVTTTMSRAPAFTIDPSVRTAEVSAPRIAGTIGTEVERRHLLSCAHR
jgi:hypothetical protein